MYAILKCSTTKRDTAMQIKRNQVIVIKADERSYCKPRLARVKSVGKDGSINCVFAMYRRSTVMSDYVISAEERANQVIAVTDVPVEDFHCLAVSFPSQDPDCVMIRKQKRVDAAWPQYAAMRKDYGARETINEGIARRCAA